MTLIPHQGSDSIDEEPVKSDSTLVIEVSPSEHVLIQQVSLIYHHTTRRKLSLGLVVVISPTIGLASNIKLFYTLNYVMTVHIHVAVGM